MKKRLLLDLPYFVEIAKNKSFSRAANVLDVPVSTLSRRMKALEKELGVQLLRRNTRNVELTEAGARFYARSEYLLSELDRMEESLIEDQRGHAGRVRVSMLADVYYLFMQGAFCSFARQYPKIEMHVFFSTHWLDPTSEPVDIDIRGGLLPDSGLVRRKLGTAYPALYASPKLLESHPMPEVPADMAKMPFISYVDQGDYILKLCRKGRTESLSIRPAHVVNSLGPSMEFALDGLGAALLLPKIARPYEEKGELIHLLPEWHAESAELSMVMAPGRLPQRVRLFVEHLAEHFRQWQR